MSKLLLITAALCMTACSNKAVYNNLYINQRNQCLKKLPPTYFECDIHNTQSYEEYKRKRQAFLEEAEGNKK